LAPEKISSGHSIGCLKRRMAEYPTADALLADVRLRLDGLGGKAAALIVEGNDDKRIFYRRVCIEAEIVPSGGKKLLRSALQSMLPVDKGRILFLTDCDYDVLNGTLRGGPDVVITDGCDVEADLVRLNLLEKIVVEHVPRVIHSMDSAAKVATDVKNDAETMALALGKVRIAAQPLGVDLGFENFNITRYWDESARKPLLDKINQEFFVRLGAGGVSIAKDEWLYRISATPDDKIICHGKDLVSAAHMILCQRYRMDHKVTAEMLMSIMRTAIEKSHFEEWTVVRRIRKWEDQNSRSLLNAAV
jgi:hypothetical protein